MGHKPGVRPGLSSPQPSQDVEFTIDQQVDQGQRERDEKERGGALGPSHAEQEPKGFDPDEQPPTQGEEKPKRDRKL